MVDAAPFRALRYDPAVAGDPASTSAPAYDEVERFTYARHRTASPYTVLELLAQGEEADYRAAAAAFARWRRTGVIVEDEHPAFFLYDIHELRHGVPTLMRGVLAAVALDAGLLPHEQVDQARVRSRARRVKAVPVDLAPVFAVHSPGPADLRSVLDAPPRTPPLVALTDDLGVDHRIWRLGDPEAIAVVEAGLAQVRAVIADGHHRHAAAVYARDTDAGADDRILTYLVDSGAYGPELRAVHRVLRGAGEDLPGRLTEDFDVRPLPWPAVLQALAGDEDIMFGLCYAAGQSALLVARDPDTLRDRLPSGRSDDWRCLDTAIWEHVVHPRVGGEVEFRSDLDAVRAEVDAEAGAALFVLRPAGLSTVDACAAAGEMMPVKTTWFRPKPRAGLVMRSLHSG